MIIATTSPRLSPAFFTMTRGESMSVLQEEGKRQRSRKSDRTEGSKTKKRGGERESNNGKTKKSMTSRGETESKYYDASRTYRTAHTHLRLEKVPLYSKGRKTRPRIATSSFQQLTFTLFSLRFCLTIFFHIFTRHRRKCRSIQGVARHDHASQTLSRPSHPR